MKIIHKLSINYERSYGEPYNAADIRFAFREGFKAARELAAKLAESNR